ncbi:MAG TPA: hypothetical protein VL200_03485 [Lacunisphaera sp.]|jgi:hypothetical protein|nr:hypothetical protein [Lacunisphaera sp.]
MKTLPPIIQQLLAFAQHESLAYYKKYYRSNGQPPLSYYLQVFSGPLLWSHRPDVLAAFIVSADRIVPADYQPARAGRDLGGYYAMGRGWIYPDRNCANHRLMLNPGAALYHRFILTPGRPALREMAFCSR